MTIDDKYVASASKLSILIFVLAGTIIYLSVREYEKWSTLLSIRRLVASWIVLDRLEERFELAEAFDKLDVPVELPLAWKTGHRHYYEGFGEVVLSKTGEGYHVVIQNSPLHSADEPGLFAEIPDLRPWEIDITATPVIEKLFAPITKETIEFSQAARTIQEEAKKKLPPEELKKFHPSWFDKSLTNPRGSVLSYEKHQLSVQIKQSLSSTGLELQSDDQILQTYRNLERKTFSSEVKVPIVELETSPEVAVGAVTLMIMVLSILLVDSLISVAPNGLREEPWFVIDAHTFPAIVLSKLWLVALAISPIVASAGYLSNLYIRRTAGDVGITGFRLHACGLAVFTVLATINTIRAVFRLLRLRSERLGQNEGSSSGCVLSQHSNHRFTSP